MITSMWRVPFGRYIDARELQEAYQMPWWLGVAWYLPYSDRAYCLPIPLNRIAGGFRAWYLAWRRPVEGDPIEGAYQLGRSEGFKAGTEHGERRMMTLIASNPTELKLLQGMRTRK